MDMHQSQEFGCWIRKDASLNAGTWDLLAIESQEQGTAQENDGIESTKVPVQVRLREFFQKWYRRLDLMSLSSIVQCGYAGEIRPYAWLRNRYGWSSGGCVA